jgi:hypothetical protein
MEFHLGQRTAIPLSGAKPVARASANLSRSTRRVNGLVGAVDLRHGHGPIALIVVLLMAHLAPAVNCPAEQVSAIIQRAG